MQAMEVCAMILVMTVVSFVCRITQWGRRGLYSQERTLAAFYVARGSSSCRWIIPFHPGYIFALHLILACCIISWSLFSLLWAPVSQCDFEVFDIFSDETIRSEVKVFSDWPTIPQVQGVGASSLSVLCFYSSQCCNGSYCSFFHLSLFVVVVADFFLCAKVVRPSIRFVSSHVPFGFNSW